MKWPSAPRLAAGALFVTLSSLPAAGGAAEPAAPARPMGDLWEVTSQMSMEGMPMALPAQKVQVCSAKEWKEPPGAADERHKCRNSDFKQEGPKVTWKTVCAGPPEMTGAGEITRNGAEAWDGTIKFASKEGNMTLKLTGKRLSPCELPQ
ncbi:MAG TPA: DUF3617 family protein [Patescibacteria group bacterium]|jgi:hypothetical protein|nr:DUF3617 family protein [Patescibacteria group bacterium]